MRLNRTARIGLGLLALAVLLIVGRAVYQKLSTPPPAPPATQAVALPAVRQPATGLWVANEDIPDRSILTADMFSLVQPSAGTPTTGYVTDFAHQAAGYVVSHDITRGTRLRPTDLLGHIDDLGIAAAIRPNFRAMVIPVTNKQTLHELVHIGDYVDIVAAFDQIESRTIVQGVRVLAVDVYGKDFPKPFKIAARGEFKADPKGEGGVEGIPMGPGSAAPTPTPTPAEKGAPAPRAEASLTLEVTPDQATALSLAEASNSPLDFLIEPRPTILNTTPVVAQLPVDTTKPQIAPYAERKKNQKPAAPAAPVDRHLGYERPPYIPNPGLQPASVETSNTYSIPIYADGKLVRTETVPKPDSGHNGP